MKPALSPTMTGFLPSRSASALTSSKTSSAVITVRITSTNCCTGAGLKKCMPTTRLGFDVATAISVTGREEVLVASTASGETTASTLPSSSFLRSRCSGTASTTSWQSARSARSLVNVTLACSASCSSWVSFPRLRARPVLPASTALPCSMAAVVDLDGDHVDPVAGEDLDDPRTHRPESDHTHTGEVTRHGRDPSRASPARRHPNGVTLLTASAAHQS